MKEYTNSRVGAIIDEHIHNERIHNERNRLILKRRLIDGVCFEPLAEEFGMSVRQIKTIVYRAEGEIFRHI